MPGKLIRLGENGQEKQSFPVVNLHVFIGSDSFCDLRIKHKGISPQHCLITAQKDKPALIRNLSRTSPTLVNGTEIGTQDVELQDQDVITVHHKKYKWQYDESHKPLNGIPGKGRKSWPLFKNKLVAVVPPNRRDEAKDVPLKKRRATVAAFGNASSKKNKVLGIKSGIKGARKSSAVKKISIRVSPSNANASIGQVALSGRKSVKFADSVFGGRRLGKRGKKSYGPATPYRASATPGKGKSSLYFTPPSSLVSDKTPKKGILKTPKSQHSSATKIGFPILNLNSSTPSGLSASVSNLEESREEESGLRTPPKRGSEQIELVLRLSTKKSSSRVASSSDSTPRSASKSKQQRDESLEASERAAKKLKQNPPVAIDKKKMAALLQCHRKSLTPHPAVNRRGRTLLELKPEPPAQPPSSPPSTPRSTKRTKKEVRKSEPAPYTKVVPKVLRFGSLGNADANPPKKKKKPPFKAVNLDRKNPISRAYAVAKMISSPSPPGRKMTRATRAARASRETMHRGEVSDVLSALDLSRKVPDPTRKPTSPVTNLSGIKELFSTERTLDVRELFLESPTLETSRQSRRTSKGPAERSPNSVNIEGPSELRSPLSTASVSSQAGSSTSRRSLTLKGPRTPLSNPKLLSESKGSSGKKKNSPRESGFSSNLQDSFTQLSDDSNFSLGSFNSSKYKSRDTSFASVTETSSTPQSSHKQSLSQKLSTISSNMSRRVSTRKVKTPRLSLRRIALTSSTPKPLKISEHSPNEADNIPLIDLTRDSPDRQLSSKKRSLSSRTTVSQRNADAEFPGANISFENLSKKTKFSKNKSKNQSDVSSADFDESRNEWNSQSDNSLKVQIGSIRKNISDNSLVDNSILVKTQLSKSVNYKRHDFPKVVARHSAPGKVTKVRTNRAQILSTPFQEKSMRSNSFININLFGLDKLSQNIVSPTPIQIKPTRSKSLVNIDLFKLDDNLKIAKLHKRSVSKGVIEKDKLSKSLPLNKSNLSSLKINSSQVSGRGSQLDSSLSSSYASPLKKSHISRKDLSTSKVLENSKRNDSNSNKSTRSQSKVNIDLFKLDEPHSSLSHKIEISSDKIIPSLLKSPDLRETGGLGEISVSKNKLTRSYSTANDKSFRSNSAEGKLKSRTSMTLESPSGIKSEGSPRRSHVETHESNSLEDRRTPGKTTEEGKNQSKVDLDRSVSGGSKSTRSRSSVNIDLFKLDDKPNNKLISKSPADDKSFRSKSAEGKLKSRTSMTLESPSRIKSGGSPRRSHVEAHKSNNLENERTPGKSAEKGKNQSKVDLDRSVSRGSKSTRSRSSVNIDLFKLDEKPPLTGKSFRSKSNDRKVGKPSKNSIASPMPKENELKKSLSNASISSLMLKDSSVLNNTYKEPIVKDKSLGTKTPVTNKSTRSSSSVNSPTDINELENKRSSNSPKKSLNQKIAYINTSVSSEKKSTRSHSFLNIDLFKLDDKPNNKLISKSPANDKSFRSKSAEGKLKSRTSMTLESPSGIKSGGSPRRSHIEAHKSNNLENRRTPSKTAEEGKNQSKVDLERSVSGRSKSTRSRSSVNIDLFKLDEKPFNQSIAKSPENKKSFRSKSAEGTRKSSKVSESTSSPNEFYSDRNSDKSRKFDDKTVDSSIIEAMDKYSKNTSQKKSFRKLHRSHTASVSSQELRKSDVRENLSLSNISRKRHSSDPREETNKSKISRSSVEEPLVLNHSDIKPTRSRSSVNFNLDEKHTSVNSPISLQSKEVLSPSKRLLNKSLTSLSNSILSPVASTPAVTTRKSKKSHIEISPIKRPKTSPKVDLKCSSSTQKKEISDQKALSSELRESEAFMLSSRKNLKDNSTLFSPKSSFTPQPERYGKKKSTRATSSVNINLFGLDESPLKQAKKSSLTPSLNKLALSSSKKVSLSTSLLRRNMSPKVYLNPLTKTLLNKIKGAQTPQKVAYDSKHTQTTTIVEKIKSPHKKKMNLDLFMKIPIVNFANNTTPVCNYEFKMKAHNSSKAKHSLEQKEIYTSKYNANDKTPLGTFSPRIRSSMSETQTVKRSSSGTQTPHNDKYKILTSVVDNINIKSKNKVSLKYSPSDKNKSLLLSTSERKKSNLKETSKSKTRGGTLSLQDSSIDTTINITPQLITYENDLDRPRVASVEKPIEKSASSKPRRGRSAMTSKLKKDFSPVIDSKVPAYRRSAKVVSLKVTSSKQNKVLSSPIIKNSPIRGKQTRSIAKVIADEVSDNQKSMNGDSVGSQKSQSSIVNESKPRRGRPPKVTSSKQDKVLSSPIIKKSTIKGKQTRANAKVTADEVSDNQKSMNDDRVGSQKGQSSIVNESKPRRGRPPKVTSSKQDKVLSSPIIKKSPIKGKQTRANPKVTADEVSKNQKSMNDDTVGSQKGQSSIVNESKPRRGKPPKVLSLKETSTKQNKVLCSPVIKTPAKGRRTRANPMISVSKNSSLHEEIRGNKEIKANKSKEGKSGETEKAVIKKNLRAAKLSDKAPMREEERSKKSGEREVTKATKPEVALNRKRGKAIKSEEEPLQGIPNKSGKQASNPVVPLDREDTSAVKSPEKKSAMSQVGKRGRSEPESEVHDISKPKVGGRRTRAAKSQDKESAKSPVSKRGRSEPESELHGVSKPKVDGRRTRAAISPDKELAKSSVSNQGRSRPVTEVNEASKHVVVRKRTRAVSSPEKDFIKFPLIKRGRSGRSNEVKETSLNKVQHNNNSRPEKTSSSQVKDKVKNVNTKGNAGKAAPDLPVAKENTRRGARPLIISPKVQLGMLAKTKITSGAEVKLRKTKTSPLTKIFSPPVTRRGKSAKSQGLSNSKPSPSPAEMNHNKRGFKKKANLKTPMKATNKIDLSSKVKKIINQRHSLVLEEAKRSTRTQKKKGGTK